MSEECVICGKPLVYLDEAEMMTCAVCGEQFRSRARCEGGHFVCGGCRTEGVTDIVEVCLNERSRDPLKILERMMSMPFCHMHGPEHHVMVGASLITAYVNAGGKAELLPSLREMLERGLAVEGGVCGFWGACGAAISTGMFVSIVTGTTPLSTESWGFANQMTSRALAAIGAIGGPRCCKRDSYTAVIEAVKFASEKLGIDMETPQPACSRSHLNARCIGERCPYSAANAKRGA